MAPAALWGRILSILNFLYFVQCNATLVARGPRVHSRLLACSRVLGLALGLAAACLDPWALGQVDLLVCNWF